VSGVRRVTPAEREPGDPTPGVAREPAIVVEGMWSGFARTEPGVVSGWHHHGDHETSIYVLSGALRLESGPAGTEITEAGPGDFVYVPPRTIHRESNPSDVPQELVVVRAGSGPPTINVEEPGERNA
jgi:uncharacterized RmlC-like cupin family protein